MSIGSGATISVESVPVGIRGPVVDTVEGGGGGLATEVLSLAAGSVGMISLSDGGSSITGPFVCFSYETASTSVAIEYDLSSGTAAFFGATFGAGNVGRAAFETSSIGSAA